MLMNYAAQPRNVGSPSAGLSTHRTMSDARVEA